MPDIAQIFKTMEYGPAPEASDPVRRWLELHERSFGHFIHGEWTEPAGGEWFESRAPASGEGLARVAVGTEPDVDRAVMAARAAFPAWSGLDGHDRAQHLYALARGIQKHCRLFAVLESLDNGKPIRESRDLDIPLVARHFYHHAGWAQLRDREFPGRVPLGVCAQVIPWNFPLLMLAWKVAPALAAGNTVVLKPAEHTPLTALLFAELTRESGLPPGVLNIVTGAGETGAALVAHPDVDKVAFTGSTDVGRLIRRATAGSGKKLSLELGGKSPFLVYEDADLDSVVEGVVDAIWFNQGQVCCAGSRILVQEGVADTLEAKLRARMETLRMGDPLDKAVDMGAIVAPVQLERIRSLVAQGEEEGARVWQPSWAVPTEGLFYPPTLCTNVAPAGTLAQVEIFGPVVALMTFRTPDESVALANNTRYGLAASIWTENVNLALDIAPRIRAGTVWVNCTNLFDGASGFGGVRESGYGREGGREGMEEYLAAARVAGATPEDPEIHSSVTEASAPDVPGEGPHLRGMDRTVKLYVGGRQRRPDGGYALHVLGPDGVEVGQVSRGNRKDVRNAVEAARKALPAWETVPAHLRAQILYYLAENLSPRREELAHRLTDHTGISTEEGRTEVDAAVRRLFDYAAWADKWEGRIHATPFRNVTLAMHEPVGVLGLVAPVRRPLVGLVSMLAPAMAVGNTVVAVPSEAYPLVAGDLIQLLETSDVPAGVVNVLTGRHDELVPVLADHDDVDGLWYLGRDEELIREVELRSAGNLKRTWTDGADEAGEAFLRQATQVKNIWVPYGA
jgi:aldehyde dehydrogenase (NAD+)